MTSKRDFRLIGVGRSKATILDLRGKASVAIAPSTRNVTATEVTAKGSLFFTTEWWARRRLGAGGEDYPYGRLLFFRGGAAVGGRVVLNNLLLLLNSYAPRGGTGSPGTVSVTMDLRRLARLGASRLKGRVHCVPLRAASSSLVNGSCSVGLSGSRVFISAGKQYLSFGGRAKGCLNDVKRGKRSPRNCDGTGYFVRPRAGGLCFCHRPSGLMGCSAGNGCLKRMRLPRGVSPSLCFAFSSSLVLTRCKRKVKRPRTDTLLCFGRRKRMGSSLPRFTGPNSPVNVSRVSDVGMFGRLPNGTGVKKLVCVGCRSKAVAILPVSRPSL